MTRKIKDIPANIGEFLKYDETSPTCLGWIKVSANKIKIGDLAGCKNNNRYYTITFNGKSYKNHRIIFFLHHGYCPEYIDHIDGNRSNNKIENLRECSISENACNAKLSKKNSSGHKGVIREVSHGNFVWRVLIRKNNKIYSKYFSIDQFQEACNYADDLRKQLHGDFSNNGIN